MGGGGEPGRVQADLSEDHLRLAYTFPSRSPGPTHPDAGRGGLDAPAAPAPRQAGSRAGLARCCACRRISVRSDSSSGGVAVVGPVALLAKDPAGTINPSWLSRDWLSPMKSAS